MAGFLRDKKNLAISPLTRIPDLPGERCPPQAFAENKKALQATMPEGLHPVFLTLAYLAPEFRVTAERQAFVKAGLLTPPPFWPPSHPNSLRQWQTTAKRVPSRPDLGGDEDGVTAAGPLPISTGFPIKPNSAPQAKICTKIIANCQTFFQGDGALARVVCLDGSMPPAETSKISTYSLSDIFPSGKQGSRSHTLTSTVI